MLQHHLPSRVIGAIALIQKDLSNDLRMIGNGRARSCDCAPLSSERGLSAKRCGRDCPTGKSRGDTGIRLSSPLRKNISVFPNPKSKLYDSPSRLTEGRFAIVTDARRDAVDADAPITNGAEADGEDVWSIF